MGFITLLKNRSSLNLMKAFLRKAFFRERQNQGNPRDFFIQTEVVFSFVLTHSFGFSVTPVKPAEAAFALLPAWLCKTTCFPQRGHAGFTSQSRLEVPILEVALQSHHIHPQSCLLQGAYNCLLGCCPLKGNL